MFYTLSIRTYLTHHFTLPNLKRLAFGISLLSCLSAGSIILFSLFSSSLHDLGFTYLEINTVASSSAIGMYLCLPVLGYLADVYGPALLSVLSIWFFCPSYVANCWIVRSAEKEITPWHVYGLSMAFLLIGLATSSLYFSALLTCAKVYPEKKGLAISLPVSFYGLSSLMGSQILKLDYFSDGDSLNLARVFSFFAVLYLFVGLLNFVSNCIVMVEQDIIFSDECAPLLENSDENELYPTHSLEPANHRSRYLHFLKDPSAWLLLVVLVLNLGPLEAYQNNLGSVIKNTTTGVSLSNQVSVMAAASTASRLFFGAASDWLSSGKRRFPISRVWTLIAVILVGALGQWGHFSSFSVTTVLNGVSYGGLFTIYPTLVASIWGIDMMGSTWGSFMVAPAIGSVAFSLFYGREVDACGGEGCLEFYLGVTGGCLVVSGGVVWGIWRAFWGDKV